ncbi:TlpA family protein disulfide reductase [Nocardioides dongkuii]|uniref:TlpA family protein disulfide reductase n=1 Tax=Nocardioides dongkuii TaxID=2760089 RepID=UPI0018776094|nr:TlpA disulfide reductase family protein [Nocardioides dongkuii]
MTRLRAVAGALLTGALLTATGACSSLEGTGDGGYIEGDGRVTQIDPGDRADPIELTGETLDGEPVDLADLRGEVVVMNTWGAWCGACHGEMPDLVAAADELGDRARFLGINTRDPSREAARSFERRYDVEYPSVDASSDPAVLLAFTGVFSPKATPTTVVLDQDGRVAAVVNGPVPSTLTLVQVVEDVLAEDA